MKIIAEGDSWFDFPRWLCTGGGVISHLEALTGMNIHNYAHRGDTAQNMLSLDQRKSLEQSIKDADVLLFSGGGNDIAGPQLITCLNENVDGDADKAINWYRLRCHMELIKAMYYDLDEIRDHVNPKCKLVTHGYDFPVPRPAGILWLGPWLYPSLEYCGWRLPQHQRSIVQQILECFNVTIRDLGIRNHLHVETQGTLLATDWHDEMHPNRAGFRKIAMKFYDAIFDSTAKEAPIV